MNTKPTSKPIKIGYLLQFIRPYRGLIVSTVLLLILARITDSLDPVWLKKIIDGASSRHSFTDLLPIIEVYFGLKALTAFFDFLRDVLFAPAEMGIAKILSEKLFTHLLALPISFHVDQKLGGVARKITRGGRAITFILDFLISNILPTLVELGIVTIFLLKLYPPSYALITLATVVAYTSFTIWSTEKRQKYRLQANIADDEVSALEIDSLTNIDTVKYFNNETQQEQAYRPVVTKRYDLSVASNRLFALISGVQGLILLTGLGGILLLAIRQTIAGQLTVGDLVLLSTYVVRLSSPISILGFIYRQIKDGLADLDGMAAMLQEEITVKEPTHPQPIAKPEGKVEFKEVNFQYSASRQILKCISLTAQPGQRIAFVGPSGVGKSTIVKLLFRFFDPTSGEIIIDGVPLDQLDKQTRRSLFGIVPQEPALFNSTIGENIRFGKPDATQKEIERAAGLASIASFIEELPDKYDTLVGERGVKLSGGEKQRVAIARAIIRQPKILVFDEATSSLDSKSEQAIQQALDTVSKGRTTLAVAHRLSTIANSDVIYVLNKGTIAEKGTHPELLKLNGIYATLWRLQAEGKGEEDEAVALAAVNVPV